MKITYLNADTGAQHEGQTMISLNLLSDLPMAEAISSVLALFAGHSGVHGYEVNAAPITLAEAITVARTDAERVEQAAEAPKAEEPPAKATRTRRPRTNPDAAPVAETHVVETPEPINAATVDEPRRRTRVTAEPAAETVKTITDADLAKACSNAAAIVGIEVVQAVIADFHVANMQELAADVREKFLGELEDEIRLAKEELAGAGK